MHLIKNGISHARTVNGDQELYNRIKESGSEKTQLKKVATEFESIFITKMLSEMDKTVDKEKPTGKNSRYTEWSWEN